MHKFRTHECGKLDYKDIGKTVKVSGWVYRVRNHGAMYFIDLKDYSGIIQVIITHKKNKEYILGYKKLKKSEFINCGSVITVKGRVVKKFSTKADKLRLSKKIEIIVEKYVIESEAKYLPINNQKSLSEDLRLRYRFLDLRRSEMQKNMKLRSKIIKFLRYEMWQRNFIELQTPILASNSSEGARNFLVPSRIYKEMFYALPQAPQQFKQLYMISGFDKYFQIAPCFRDENARTDRTPGEFYQLDIEMSFVTQEDIFATVESILFNTFRKFSSCKISNIPFTKITYSEAMLKYGSEKPDLRNPVIIYDATIVFRSSEFDVFCSATRKDYVVRGITINDHNNLNNRLYNNIITFAKQKLRVEELLCISVDTHDNIREITDKLLEIKYLQSIKKSCFLKRGSITFFLCDKKKIINFKAMKMRRKLGAIFNLIRENEFKFCWITDYPLYKWNKSKRKIEFFHNPFSMPQGDLKSLNRAKTLKNKLNIRAYQYDIVCNGIELSSGAIRNHKLLIMCKVFKIAGFNVKKMFPAIFKALQYGAPPHGGAAPGVDRIVMLLAGKKNLREIIGFPLNQKSRDALFNTPSKVTLV